MVAGNKMSFDEDREIYIEMLSLTSTAPLKEEFPLPISIFPYILPYPQRG